MKDKYCLLTNDVETHSIWYNTLRDETGKKVLEEGMPILLDIYAEFNIKSTFFFTGYIAQKFPEVVKMIIPYGHEVASHGYSHEVEQAFDVLPLQKQIEHLKKSKDILEDICGEEVISFRAPALRINSDTAIALANTGFKVDSSVASQRFDMFLSFGGLKKLKWFTSPRLPYRTKENDLFKKGNGNVVEIPLTAMFLPFTSTTMRIFPAITSVQKHFFNFETIVNGKPIVFDIHPNEFIDETEVKREIKKRSNNVIKYLLADVVRGKLKINNLGKPAIPIYKDLIEFFKNKDYKTITIRDYCNENKLFVK